MIKILQKRAIDEIELNKKFNKLKIRKFSENKLNKPLIDNKKIINFTKEIEQGLSKNLYTKEEVEKLLRIKNRQVIDNLIPVIKDFYYNNVKKDNFEKNCSYIT